MCIRMCFSISWIRPCIWYTLLLCADMCDAARFMHVCMYVCMYVSVSMCFFKNQMPPCIYTLHIKSTADRVHVWNVRQTELMYACACEHTNKDACSRVNVCYTQPMYSCVTATSKFSKGCEQGNWFALPCNTLTSTQNSFNEAQIRWPLQRSVSIL